MLRGDRCGAGGRSASVAGAASLTACAWRFRPTSCSTAWTQRSALPSTARCALSQAGARIVASHSRVRRSSAVNAKGGFAASEAYAWHRALLAEKGAGYDPRIRMRIERGERMTAVDYLELVAARPAADRRLRRRTREFDALVMPTVPIVPPRIADLDDEHEYNRINMHILRNTALGNFFDRCSISLPCHRDGEPPVGLMLMGETMGDARLFSIAAAVEARYAEPFDLSAAGYR